jgi:AGCS family alanine or glycine:cation symporter
LCFSFVLLYHSREFIPGALRQIAEGALGLREAAGGVAGYGVASAMRYGLSRGVFTNEAGLGSAPIAHACADCESPSHQAAWGVFEVFVDTIVVCTITALVILCAGGGNLLSSGLDGAALTSAAFESAFPGIGAGFVAVAIMFFAMATMVGWCFYGESALRYLSGGKRSVYFYRVTFIVCIVLGSVAGLRLVWQISDVLNSMMALPNCIALAILWRQIKWGVSSQNTSSSPR